ncbi:MAG: L-asparagine permease [Mycobacterium sp.]|nr:L-asparagine permease [Mycobacterium sp.]MDT5189588.1 L-asparagine permease [Mycobacterium sp.]MDT5263912.1 L-asparagine permease [Mycobacterium sp.]
MIVPALIAGWYAVRPRVLEMARERVGYTGNYPVVAETPLMDELLDKDARETRTTKKADTEQVSVGADLIRLLRRIGIRLP